MTPQQSIGHYRIVSKLGEGGMGVVYRATDSKLHRDVAIKVLPEAFSQDPARMQRFEREAQVLATLNHPNIAAIYGIEDNAFVMELVEGESLRTILERGPLPLETALPYAAQIAEALEAAHEKGVVHRDLKPANIMVTPSGAVKVLDFGLAAVMHGPTAASAERANSPTLTMQATQAGVILGTAGYMSPEQAAGKPVDKRADVWSFGVVLWEMLTGRTLFTGETTSHVLADVLRGPIDLDQLPRDTPGAIRTLLARCLDRNVRNRLRDIGEARVAIQSAGKEPPQAAPLPVAKRTSLLWPAIAAVLLLAICVLLFRDSRVVSKATPAMPLRASLDLTPAEHLANDGFGRPSKTDLTFSPDGSVLVFSGVVGSALQLYRRALDQSEAVPIPGTEGGTGPFFSPDGRWIGFYAQGALRKVSTNGGPAVTICKLGDEKWGATWGAEDSIVFSGDGDVQQVSAQGGDPKVLLKGDSATSFYYSTPEFLPDGKTLLLTQIHAGGWDAAEVAVLLPGGKPRVLLKGGANPRYVAAGYLLYMRQGALLAAPFDVHRLEITGAAVPLLDGVMQAVDEPNEGLESGLGQFAVSRTGTLVYGSGGTFPRPKSTLISLDRNGAITELNPKRAETYGLRISPDGRRFAGGVISTTNRAQADVESYDLERGTSTLVTRDGASSWPIWSPDQRRLLFSVNDTKIESLSVDGVGTPETIATGGTGAFAVSWSRDGKWLAYMTVDSSKSQMWVRPMTEHGEPRLFLETKSQLLDGYFSPDGKWIAYSTDESGAFEVYVRPFPGPGAEHRISTATAMNPAWNPNGRELFYLERHGAHEAQKSFVNMMAVDIDANDPFHAGIPHKLFAFPEGQSVATLPVRSYDVYPDGQHFLAQPHEYDPGPAVIHLNVVANWFEELRRRAPAGR
jgi:serine/threonine-protein kinase